MDPALYQQQLANYQQQLYGMFAGGSAAGSTGNAWQQQQQQQQPQQGNLASMLQQQQQQQHQHQQQNYGQGYQTSPLQQLLATQLANQQTGGTASSYQAAPQQPYRSLLSGGVATSPANPTTTAPTTDYSNSSYENTRSADQFGGQKTSMLAGGTSYETPASTLLTYGTSNEDSRVSQQTPALTSIAEGTKQQQDQQQQPAIVPKEEQSYRTGYQQYAAKQKALPKLSEDSKGDVAPVRGSPTRQEVQQNQRQEPYRYQQQFRQPKQEWENWGNDESWNEWENWGDKWNNKSYSNDVGVDIKEFDFDEIQEEHAKEQQMRRDITAVPVPAKPPTIEVGRKLPPRPTNQSAPLPTAKKSPPTRPTSIPPPPVKPAAPATKSSQPPPADVLTKMPISVAAAKTPVVPPPPTVPSTSDAQPAVAENPYASFGSDPKDQPSMQQVKHPGMLPPQPTGTTPQPTGKKKKKKKKAKATAGQLPPPPQLPASQFPLASQFPPPVQLPQVAQFPQPHQTAIQSFQAGYRSKQAPHGYKESNFIITRTPGQKLGMDFDGTTVKKTWPHLDAYKCGIRPGMIVACIGGRDVWSAEEVKKEFTNSVSKRIRVIVYEKKPASVVDPEKKYIWLYNIPKSYGVNDTRTMVEKFGPVQELWKYDTAYIVEFATRSGVAQALTLLEDIGTLPGGDRAVTIEYKAAPKKVPLKSLEIDTTGSPTKQKRSNSQQTPEVSKRPKAEPPAEEFKPAAVANPYSTTSEQPAEPEIPENITAWIDRGCRDPTSAAQFYANARANLREAVFLHGIHPKNTSNSGTCSTLLYPLPFYFIPELVNDLILFSAQASGLSVPKMVQIRVYKGKKPINGYEYSIAEVQTEQAREAAQIVGCLDGFGTLLPGLELDESNPGISAVLGNDSNHEEVEKGKETVNLTPRMMSYQSPIPVDYIKPCRYHCVMGHCFNENCSYNHFRKGDTRISKKLVKITGIPPIWRPKQVQELLEQKWGHKKSSVVWIDILKEQNSGFVAIIQCWKASAAKDLMVTFNGSGNHGATQFIATEFHGTAKPVAKPAEEPLIMPLPLPPLQQQLVDQMTEQRLNKSRPRHIILPSRAAAVTAKSNDIVLSAIRKAANKETESLRQQVESLTKANSELWKTSLGLVAVATGGQIGQSVAQTIPMQTPQVSYPHASVQQQPRTVPSKTPVNPHVSRAQQKAHAVPRPSVLEKRVAESISPAKKIQKRAPVTLLSGKQENEEMRFLHKEILETRSKIEKYKSVLEIRPSRTVESKVLELRAQLYQAEEKYQKLVDRLPKALEISSGRRREIPSRQSAIVVHDDSDYNPAPLVCCYLL